MSHGNNNTNCKECEGQNVPCNQCDDPALVTSSPCGEGVECQGDECSETFNSACVKWVGADLVCNSTVVATEGDSMMQVLSNIVALFCNANQPAITLLVPDPDNLIDTPDDQIICIDRNNCTVDLTIAVEAGGPAVLFTWDEVDSTPHVDEATMVIESERSCLLFQINTTALTPGVYNFDLEITGCGATVLVPVSLTIL